MEIWSVLDENRNNTGKTIIKGVDTLPEGLYHESVGVWIINSENKILIQKRAANKKRYPNMWAMTGGARLVNESNEDAIIRETKEEIGIDIKEEELKFIGTLKSHSAFIDMFIVNKDIKMKEIVKQDEEVSDVKWASYEEMEKLYENGELVKNRWEFIKPYIKKYFN